MDKEEVLVMFTMAIIIGVGVIYTVITDYQSSFIWVQEYFVKI